MQMNIRYRIKKVSDISKIFKNEPSFENNQENFGNEKRVSRNSNQNLNIKKFETIEYCNHNKFIIKESVIIYY